MRRIVGHPGIAADLCTCGGKVGYTRVVGADDFVCSRCLRPSLGYETQKTKIVIFRGGALDGRAFNFTDLVTEDSGVPIIGYRWTAETVTSELTGQTARVWVWDDQAALAHALRINHKHHGVQENGAQPMQNTSSAGATHTQLFERRKALGLSRTQLCEQAGITTSQLGSMETSGKRVKPGVMDAVERAIVHFERQRGTSSEPKEADTAR